MLIRDMVAAVQKRTGVGRRKARSLISDGAERLDLACDTRDGHLNPEPAYSEQDIIDYAVECYEDEKIQQEQDPHYEQDPGEN